MFCIKHLTKSIELLKRNKKEIVQILFTLNGVYHCTNKIKSYQKCNVLHQRSDKSIELLKRNKKEIVQILFTLNGVYRSINKIKSYQKSNVLHQRFDKIN